MTIRGTLEIGNKLKTLRMMEEDRAKGEIPPVDCAEKISVLNTCRQIISSLCNLNLRQIFARLAS